VTQIWPLVITVVSVTPVWLLTRGQHRAGNLTGLGAQAVWVAWAVTTHQWAFLGNAAIYATVYARGLDNRERETE
jgi:hypothetical protein